MLLGAGVRECPLYSLASRETTFATLLASATGGLHQVYAYCCWSGALSIRDDGIYNRNTSHNALASIEHSESLRRRPTNERAVRGWVIGLCHRLYTLSTD